MTALEQNMGIRRTGQREHFLDSGREVTVSEQTGQLAQVLAARPTPHGGGPEVVPELQRETGNRHDPGPLGEDTLEAPMLFSPTASSR